MRIAREYLTYLSRALGERLRAEKYISAPDGQALNAVIHQALEQEFGVDDRINEEARTILSANAAEMQRLGANYGDAFKKIKAELVRKHKAVL